MATQPKPHFTRKQAISLPSISLEENKIRYFRFDAIIVKGTRGSSEAAAGPESGRVDTTQRKQKEPPYLVVVTDMETGEKGMLIVNAVLYSTMKQMFPNDGYVGKTFEVEKLPKAKGKDYHTFNVYEVEIK